jgi:hypothetical protein
MTARLLWSVALLPRLLHHETEGHSGRQHHSTTHLTPTTHLLDMKNEKEFKTSK